MERESRLGRDEYDWGVSVDRDTYLDEARDRYERPIVCRDYREPIDLFDRHLYEKGGLVLHMLRRRLGDEVFWRGVALYLERHAHGIVETNDLMRALEAVSGESLERFFDQWVYRPGHPELRVKIGWEDGLLGVRVKQKQKGEGIATFAFPLEILVQTRSGKLERHRKDVTESTDALIVPLDERPAFVVFDPELRVLGKRHARRAGRHAAPPAGPRSERPRSLGCRRGARRDGTTSSTVRALASTLHDERQAWMVRVVAARSLGKIRSDAAFDALVKGARARHPKVRRAVATALGAFRTPGAAKVLTLLARKDPSYLVGAEASRALGRTRQPGAKKTLLALAKRPSWGDCFLSGALDGLGNLRDEETVPNVIAHTGYGHPTRGRRSAIHALATLTDSRRAREHLEDLLSDRGSPRQGRRRRRALRARRPEVTRRRCAARSTASTIRGSSAACARPCATQPRHGPPNASVSTTRSKRFAARSASSKGVSRSSR